MDIRSNNSNMKLQQTSKKNMRLFLLPVALIMGAIILFPVLDTFRLSFFDASFIKPGLDSPMIGFGNYIEALNDNQFWSSFKITLNWAFLSVIFQFTLGMYFALLFNTRAGKLKHSDLLLRVLRSLFLIPWMVPGSLAAIIWKWMYHGSVGLINHLFLSIGIIDQTIPWLASSETVLWACLVVNIWRGTPFFMVMLLGGLQTVPKHLFEAAKIDGASSVSSFIHVTIPHLRSLIMTLLIFGFMGAFNFLDIILVLTRGGPANHSLILPLYAWLAGFYENRIGYSATISVLMCIILVIFTALITVLRKGED